MTAASGVRAVATPESRPHLPRHARLQFDALRQQFVVLGPERVYWPDAVSVDILKLCDGDRSVADMAKKLAADYAASVETIEDDILEFVQSWTDMRLLRV